MTKEQAIEKLKRIKALVDRPGTDGEKQAALALYNRLLEKYQLADNEVAEEIKKRWFHYSLPIERKLLDQIIYAVTGDTMIWHYKDKRCRDCGIECTEAEAAEIEFLFNFYRAELQKQLDLFMSAFIQSNDIYPDENARAYKPSDNWEITDRDLEVDRMAKGIKKAMRPRALIED